MIPEGEENYFPFNVAIALKKVRLNNIPLKKIKKSLSQEDTKHLNHGSKRIRNQFLNYCSKKFLNHGSKKLH